MSGTEGTPCPPPVRLPPGELGARLDRILAATEELIAAMPSERLESRPPRRDRSLRDLGFHAFRLALAFADGMDLGRLPGSWLQDQAPPDLLDGPSIARYGALVRGRLAGWFEGAGPGEYARVIDVYDGPRTGHELLERTTWRAAQHLRQLHALAGELGLRPPRPLPTADLEGLPPPSSLW